uniref:Putative ovule protein n=1 Tax=Solanum chacoense TaxID=4108 RepID=A0A0V0HWM7_SOLCH
MNVFQLKFYSYAILKLTEQHEAGKETPHIPKGIFTIKFEDINTEGNTKFMERIPSSNSIAMPFLS